MRIRLRLQFTSVQVYVCCLRSGYWRVGLGTPSRRGLSSLPLTILV
jgi:hypothetical protein